MELTGAAALRQTLASASPSVFPGERRRRAPARVSCVGRGGGTFADEAHLRYYERAPRKAVEAVARDLSKLRAMGLVAGDAAKEKILSQTGLPVNHGTQEASPQSPPKAAVEFIKGWVQRAPVSALARHWVVHTTPRLVYKDVTHLLQQLIGPHPLTHEVAAVIMRQFGQIDDETSREAVGMKWRKFMDPDFASIVLKGADLLNVQSIHEMFVGDAAAFSVASTRMFYIPAILPDGWCLYLMDMLQKRIVVLDPKAGTLGHTSQRVRLHDAVSTKLLIALFRCIDRFYCNWCTGNDGWTRNYPIIMDEYFTSELSGICMTFFAKHFDGEKLMIPLSKETLETHRNTTLYDVMGTKKNLSKVPEDAIEAIKTTFFVL